MPPPSTVTAVRALVWTARILERAAPELTLAQYRVLATVADGEERASRLAARLALGKPTISAAVDALCARGLLARAKSPEDQRAISLSLTGAGSDALAAAEAAMAGALDDLCAHTAEPALVLRSLAQLEPAISARRRTRAQ